MFAAGDLTDQGGAWSRRRESGWWLPGGKLGVLSLSLVKRSLCPIGGGPGVSEKTGRPHVSGGSGHPILRQKR